MGFFLLLTVLFISSVSAAQLHVILVGANYGDTIAFESSLDKMRRTAYQIAARSGLELNLSTFEDFQVTAKNVKEHLASLEVGSDDTILYYSVLHGSRYEEKKNSWPDQHFFDGNVDFNDFNLILSEKNPRLLISIAESCNSNKLEMGELDGEDMESDSDDVRMTIEEFLAMKVTPPTIEKTNQIKISAIQDSTEDNVMAIYRKLFAETSGSIIIASSSPGESAICHPIIGGFYTASLILALENLPTYVPDDTEVKWDAILNLSKAYLEDYLKKLGSSDFIQTPQFEISKNIIGEKTE